MAASESPARYVLMGGMMIEETPDPFGSLREANVAGGSGNGSWMMEAPVFGTNFRFGVDEFQSLLPRNLIHHMEPGKPIHESFEGRKKSAVGLRAAQVHGLGQLFTAAAGCLSQKGYKISLKRKFASGGYLVREL